MCAGQLSSATDLECLPGRAGVCLSSRRNLCIHPQVSQFDNRNKGTTLRWCTTPACTPFYRQEGPRPIITRKGRESASQQFHRTARTLHAASPVCSVIVICTCCVSACAVDAMCRNLTATFVREKKEQEPSTSVCEFYEGYRAAGASLPQPLVNRNRVIRLLPSVSYA